MEFAFKISSCFDRKPSFIIVLENYCFFAANYFHDVSFCIAVLSVIVLVTFCSVGPLILDMGYALSCAIIWKFGDIDILTEKHSIGVIFKAIKVDWTMRAFRRVSSCIACSCRSGLVTLLVFVRI